MIYKCVLQDEGRKAEGLELRDLEALKNMKTTRLNVIFQEANVRGCFKPRNTMSTCCMTYGKCVFALVEP